MKEIIFIILFLLVSFYSYFLQLKFFRKKIGLKRIVLEEAIVLLLIIIMNIYLLDIFNWELFAIYISSNVFLLDLQYLFFRLVKNEIKKDIDELLRTTLISIFSAIIFGVITSLKFGSTLYAIPYLIVVFVVLFIESIIFIKKAKKNINNEKLR